MDADAADWHRSPPTCGETWVSELGTCPAAREKPKAESRPPRKPAGEPSDVQKRVGPKHYEEMRALLAWSFPGRNKPVPDVLVDGAFWALDSIRQTDGLKLPLPSLAKTPSLLQAPDIEESHPVRYYASKPVHDRAQSAPHSRFMQPVPLIRFDLPPTGRETIRTKVGWAMPGDRKFNSLEDVGKRVEPTVGYRPGRVELITAARWLGRFASVAVYLAYRKADDPAPDFYMVEAGLASGEPRVVYLATSMKDPIDARAGYEPTPFATVNNWYKARLTLKDGHPTNLLIQSFRQRDGDPYVTVNLSMRHTTDPKPIVPLQYLVMATMRLLAIGNALDTGPKGELVRTVLLPTVRQLPWMKLPARPPGARTKR